MSVPAARQGPRRARHDGASGLAAGQGEQRAAVEVLGRGDAGEVEDRRADVGDGAGAADRAGREAARGGDEERDPQDFVPQRRPVAEGAVLGEGFSVVARDEDHRALGQARRIERRERTREDVVGPREPALVRLAQPAGDVARLGVVAPTAVVPRVHLRRHRVLERRGRVAQEDLQPRRVASERPPRGGHPRRRAAPIRPRAFAAASRRPTSASIAEGPAGIREMIPGRFSP